MATTPKQNITFTQLVALTGDDAWVRARIQAKKTCDEIHAEYLALVESGRLAAQAAVPETAEQTIARLMAENAALKAQPKTLSKVTMKFSEKGTNPITGKETKGGSLCIYGMQRFPLSFYLSTLERLIGSIDSESDLGMVNEIKAFARLNRGKFATKA